MKTMMMAEPAAMIVIPGCTPINLGWDGKIQVIINVQVHFNALQVGKNDRRRP